MSRVKICGITSLADARQALLAGADFLGFIFYPPSPRHVTEAQVTAIVVALRAGAGTRELLAQADSPQLVGVFVNEAPGAVASVLDDCGLHLAQLSGDEPPSYILSSESPLAGRAYYALRPQSPDGARAGAQACSAPTPPDAPTLLLDTYHPALRGGTGETADWAMARELQALTPRLMLAGGLTPDNVAAAVRQVRPFAVDVASGVEAGPGRKDPEKVRRFIAAAKAGEA